MAVQSEMIATIAFLMASGREAHLETTLANSGSSRRNSGKISGKAVSPGSVSSTFAFMPLVVRRVGAFALAFVNPGHGAGLTKPVP